MQCAVNSPGPARLVSIHDRISLPTTPCRKPSPEHKTFDLMENKLQFDSN